MLREVVHCTCAGDVEGQKCATPKVQTADDAVKARWREPTARRGGKVQRQEDTVMFLSGGEWHAQVFVDDLPHTPSTYRLRPPNSPAETAHATRLRTARD